MAARIKGIPPYGMMIISIAYVIEITGFPLILGSMTQTMGLAESTAHLLVSSYKFALVASILIAGWLGDRHSREVVFAIGAGLFATSSLAILAIPSPEAMVPLRIMQGIGAGLFSPMIPALLAARRPENTLSALSIWGMLTGAASAVYPFIAAHLTTNYGWQAGWLLIPALACLALLGLPTKTDRQQAAQTERPTSLRQGFSQLGRYVWAIMAYVFLNYGLTSWFLVAVALTGSSNGINLTVLGFVFFVLWSVFSFVNYALSLIAERASLPVLLTLGAAANCLGVFMFAMNPANVTILFVSAIFIGFGMALNNAPTTDLAFRLSPKSMHGSIASLDIIAARLGGAVFVLLVPQSGILACYIGAACLALSLVFIVFANKGIKLKMPSASQVLL